MENVLIIVSLVIIVGLAVFYIYKSKKSGNKCVGCSDGCTCGGHSNCNCEDDE